MEKIKMERIIDIVKSEYPHIKIRGENEDSFLWFNTPTGEIYISGNIDGYVFAKQTGKHERFYHTPKMSFIIDCLKKAIL